MSKNGTYRNQPSPGKVFVLSLDGISKAFLERHGEDGLMPRLARVTAEGGGRELNSVLPPVSLTAWASYATGVNPGRHGIYGFFDRPPGRRDLYVPTSRSLTQAMLWETVSRAGARVVVLNVPLTYPPRQVNGVLVSGFLSPSVEKAVYPPEKVPLLRRLNYRIDVDVKAGKDDRGRFLADLETGLRKRFEAATLFMEEEHWDFFQLHVMETDRINHLLWADYEDEDSIYHDAFVSFYGLLDDLAGELLDRLPPECAVVILSDHGFCRRRKEVALNRYLEERDWLRLAHRKQRRLQDILPGSLAYSLAPGRIYMNLRGREEGGVIERREEYHGYREGLRADLLSLRDPDTDTPVAAAVLRGEEAFSNPGWGEFPVSISESKPAPCDLLVIPAPGYDVKGYLDRKQVFAESGMSGMHTADGGFVALRGAKIAKERPAIVDLYPTVLALLGIELDVDIDGESIL